MKSWENMLKPLYFWQHGLLLRDYVHGSFALVVDQSSPKEVVLIVVNEGEPINL